MPENGPTAAEIEGVVRVLESLSADRGPLSRVPEALRNRLMAAAGRVASPAQKELRRLRKAERKAEERERERRDEVVLGSTRIRGLRTELVFPTPPVALPSSARGSSATLEQERACYVCKSSYSVVHFFYDAMCEACGDLNYEKRNQTADLGGRVALITGARVKIGYQASIKLLRAGARVIVTTRFPRDAAARYAAELDHEAFADRLEIHGLDLRHTPSVELFARSLLGRLDRLDFIINNACQTVRRPAGFYRHLLERETAPRNSLPAVEQRFLSAFEGSPQGGWSLRSTSPSEQGESEPFPVGRLDADLQQVDLRDLNSWRLKLAEVSTLELLEVHLANAVAPFVLNARLKPLMAKVATRDKHIVNVSAMEGQFYKTLKTDRHPHTNMAKASLNMMTRTSAIDLVKDGIHMNSVDTGWVTDEDPVAYSEKKALEQGVVFQPPLDVVDGAARIVDPIFSGIRTGRHVFGQFLKDYRPVPW